MSFRLLATAIWCIAALLVLYSFSVAIMAFTGDVSSYPLIGPLLSRPHLIDKAPPVLILLLSAWALFEIALKQREVRRQHAAIASFQSMMAEADQNKYQAKAFDLRQPRGIRRADLIIDASRREPSSLHEAVPAAAALDATTMSASYGPLNVYAWTLPVLGFIGTAAGMASSIAGFSDVLAKTAKGDTTEIQIQLSQSVIPGLAAAFETTILALAAALVVYFCTNALRNWDQEALDQLDRLCIVLLERIPQPPTPDGQKILAVLEEISAEVRGLLQVPAALESAAKSMSVITSDQFVTAAGAISAASETLASASNQTISAAEVMREAAEAFDAAASKAEHLKISAEKSMTAGDLASALVKLREAIEAPITFTMTRGGDKPE